MPDSPLNFQQQLLLCQQVAKLVRAKLPLAGELARSTQHASRKLADSAQAVEQEIAGGKSLASALAGDASRNSRILSACVEAGERAHTLDRTLESWAAMHLANARSSKAMRSAMIYPSILIVVTLLSLSFLIWHLIPEYRVTYMLFSQQLPSWLAFIVRIREQMGPVIFLLVLLMLLPLVVWFWRRRSFDAHGIPREAARRLRLQALASDLSSDMLLADLPLTEVVDLSTRAMHAKQSDVEQAFDRLKHQQLIVPLPRESSLLLASLHAGLIDRNEAAGHLRAVAKHLRQNADLTATRSARWLPMLIALIVGGITILTYLFLIYLPWIALLTRIVDADVIGPPR